MQKNRVQLAAIGACLVAGSVLLIAVARRPSGGEVMTISGPDVVEAREPRAPISAPRESSVAAPDPLEEEMQELKYLPEKVNIRGGDGSSVLRMPDMREGARRVYNVRPLTDKDRHGDFYAPKFSPDGLQMIISRPGFNGIFLLDANGGDPFMIAEGNAYGAKWTPEGNVEVRGDDGQIRIYGPDGTLLSTRPIPSDSGPVYNESDTIFVRNEAGVTLPITGSDDRYFNPVLSPDGSTVVYQGLTTGLHMAPADGSGTAVFIGMGNNPVWMADGSGVVFDVTADDGHYLTEGDIYFVDSNATERTNLTQGDNMVGQMPTVDPSGNTVVFEADGTIYRGEVQ